nr:hypothetical protein [Tanacetum cinerariifolium]
MESVKKSIDKRALHKQEYDSWVNERQMQTTEEKVDTSKALDASLVDIESSKIFKTVGLRWVPTGKIITSSTTKVDSEPINSSNKDITNLYECEQTLDVSAVQSWFQKLFLQQLVSSQQEFNLLFGPLYDEIFTAGTSSVNKSSSLTDNSKKQDTPPSATAQSTIELITPTTTISAEDNM